MTNAMQGPSRNERSRARAAARVVSPQDPLRFMGEEFPSRQELEAQYPAFAGDDAIRAIRAGCATVLAVETFCWEFRNRAYLKARQAAQRSQYSARNTIGRRQAKKGAKRS